MTTTTTTTMNDEAGGGGGSSGSSSSNSEIDINTNPSLKAKLKECLDIMNKNVRVVNQLEFEKLQKASSKRQAARQQKEKTNNNSSTKTKGTAAGFKTTGLDNDNDNDNATTTIHNNINNNNNSNNNSNIKRRLTSARSELSDTSSEESSPIDNDSDSDSADDADDADEAQLFDMEHFKKIRADVLERMDDHIATKKPYPKSPPGNALPKGVHYKASSGKNYVARAHHNSLQLHIGTWGQPEQAHQAWFYMSEAVADFERKKQNKNKKRKKQPEPEQQEMQQQHRKKKQKRHDGNKDTNNDNSPAAAGAPPPQPQQPPQHADADDAADPHMAHFHRIRRRREVLPCAEREQELLLSFSIMQEEMQLLFQRVNYFKTQLADERHRQIFRKEVRDNVMLRRGRQGPGRGRGPEEGTHKNNNDGNSNNNNNVVDE